MTDPETLQTTTVSEEGPKAVLPVAEAPETRLEREPASDGCPSCGSGNTVPAPSFVYALGRIEARFPTLSLEKELAQATGRAETAGLTDRQALRSVLAERQNRYLVRKLCWTLTIEGLETYILHPQDTGNWDPLVDALRPTPRASDIDVVIGMRGPIAPPDLCNGLQVPIVLFSQIYSFDVDSLVKSIPRPEETSEAEFAPAAEELFGRIIQLADNAGSADEHRALNYVATRYPAIYATTADAYKHNAALTAVDVKPSRLSGVRRIVSVILSYTNRQTDVVEKYFTRVDMTEEFPFLVTKMSPYYDR